MTPKKDFIIDLMLSSSNYYNPRMIFDIPKPDQIRLLNTLVYLAIYQKMANNHRYDIAKIVEYFEFDEYETYLLNLSCSRLKRFGLIDTEYGWIEELLPVDKSYIYTIVVDRNDIGNSTIEFYQLPDGTPLASSERSMTFIPKKIPDPLAQSVKPKTTTAVKKKLRSRVIKKSNINNGFDR